MTNNKNIKESVKEKYGNIAKTGSSCCQTVSCCGNADISKISQSIGYSIEEMKNVPEGANLGLGCGNPVALASLKKGDTVLDLGSGAGFDAFLASNAVGNSGKVIGDDMTPQMIEKARTNAIIGNFTNVEFRLGEIEKLPVENNSIDVIISNCVINLSTDKASVFKEAFRVLKPNGKLMVSDLVLIKELSQKIKESVEAYVGCVAGAIMKDDYLAYIKAAGFKKVEIKNESEYLPDSANNGITSYVTSIKVQAIKIEE